MCVCPTRLLFHPHIRYSTALIILHISNKDKCGGSILELQLLLNHSHPADIGLLFSYLFRPSKLRRARMMYGRSFIPYQAPHDKYSLSSSHVVSEFHDDRISAHTLYHAEIHTRTSPNTSIFFPSILSFSKHQQYHHKLCSMNFYLKAYK